MENDSHIETQAMSASSSEGKPISSGATSQGGLLSAREAAALLDCTVDHVGRLCRSAKLEGVRTGTTWQVTPSSIEKYQTERTQQKQDLSRTLSELRKKEAEAFRIRSAQEKALKAHRKAQLHHVLETGASVAIASLLVMIVGFNANGIVPQTRIASATELISGVIGKPDSSSDMLSNVFVAVANYTNAPAEIPSKSSSDLLADSARTFSQELPPALNAEAEVDGQVPSLTQQITTLQTIAMSNISLPDWNLFTEALGENGLTIWDHSFGPFGYGFVAVGDAAAQLQANSYETLAAGVVLAGNTAFSGFNFSSGMQANAYGAMGNALGAGDTKFIEALISVGDVAQTAVAMAQAPQPAFPFSDLSDTPLPVNLNQVDAAQSAIVALYPDATSQNAPAPIALQTIAMSNISLPDWNLFTEALGENGLTIWDHSFGPFGEGFVKVADAIGPAQALAYMNFGNGFMHDLNVMGGGQANFDITASDGLANVYNAGLDALADNTSLTASSAYSVAAVADTSGVQGNITDAWDSWTSWLAEKLYPVSTLAVFSQTSSPARTEVPPGGGHLTDRPSALFQNVVQQVSSSIVPALPSKPSTSLVNTTYYVTPQPQNLAANYVTQDSLTTQLQELSNNLRSLIYANAGASSQGGGTIGQGQYATGGYTNNTALSQIISHLDNITITNATITGSTVNGASNFSSSVPGALASLADVAVSSPAWGNLLEYNGTSWVNVATSSLGIVGGAGVSLTGSTGQVAYFSGTNTAVGTSSLFLSTAGNVGIGTAGPSIPLDVRGTATVGIGYTNTSGHALIKVDGASASQAGYYIYKSGTEKAQIAVLGNSNDLTFNMAGTPRMTLATGGNVGIGNTTPNYLLDVAGLGHFTGLVDAPNFVATSSLLASIFKGGFLSNASSTIGDGTAGLTVNGPATTTGNQYVGGSLYFPAASGIYFANTIAFGGDGGSTYVQGGASNGIRFRNASTVEIGRFTNTGNFGLGTTSPYAQLSIANSTNSPAGQALFAIASSTANSTTTLFSISNTGRLISNATATSTFAAVIQAPCFSTDGVTCITGGTVTGSVGNWFTSATFGSSASNATSTLLGFNNGFYSLASSTIGDGINGLTISGNATTTGNLIIGNGSAATPSLSFVQGGGTTGFYSSGASGINFTSAGTARWGFSGNGLSSVVTNGPSFQNQTSLSLTAPDIIPNRADATTGFASGITGNINAIVGGTEITRWTGTGFGVGTTSPFALLSVATPNGSTGALQTLFAIASSTQAGATTTVFSVSSAGNVVISGTLNVGGNIANTGILLPSGGCANVGASGITAACSINNNIFQVGPTVSTGNLALLAGNVERIRVTTLGNVGVGSTTPWAKFSINNSTNDTAGQPLFVVASSTASATTTAFIITNNGNVGIGTSSPTTQLDLAGSFGQLILGAINQGGSIAFRRGTDAVSGANVGWLSAVSGTSFGVTVGSGNGNLQLRTTSNSSSGGVQFITNNLERGRFDFNGNFGVGTTSPWAQFSVNNSTNGPFNQPLFVVASSTASATTTAFIITNSGNVGIGTTSPDALFAIAGTAASTDFRIERNTANNPNYFAISAPGGSNFASNLSVNGINGLTLSANNATGFATNVNIGIGSTTPYAKLSVAGTIVADNINATSTIATSTFAGGLNVGSGNLTYDLNSGITSINNLAIGSMNFDTDAGIVNWADLPLDSNASAGTQESYSANVGGAPVLTVYGEADGAGNSQNLRVGIGSTSPSLIGGTAGLLTLDRSNFNAYALLTYASTTGSISQVAFANGNGVVGHIDTSGSATTYNTSSDRRIKQDIASTTLGLDTLMQLPVRDFDFINDPAHATTTGFIAQELFKVFPAAVSTNGDDGTGPLATTSLPWSVDYGRITPLIVKAVQDIASLSTTFKNTLIAWLGDTKNGIGKFFAKEVHTQKLCVGDGTNETCVTKAQLDQLLAAPVAASGTGGTSANNSSSKNTSTTTADTTAPVITLQGANPATVNVGDTYSDLGATVTDNVNNNLGYTVSFDGATSTSPDQLHLDTTVVGDHTIVFSSTDQAGNTGTATRVVHVVSVVPPSPIVPVATSSEATSTPAN